jgi:hypothetical protein
VAASLNYILIDTNYIINNQSAAVNANLPNLLSTFVFVFILKMGIVFESIN